MLRNALKIHSTSCQISYRNIFECWAPRFLSQDSRRPVSKLDEAAKRKRKTEWKRLQRGQSFLDHLVVSVRGGKGGDGCVAFQREKYKPYGPPSGGNGGRGGDVYILPTPELTTLSSVPKRVRGASGAHGQGTWMNGKAGEPTVIRVPVGTVVKQLVGEDATVANEQWETEERKLDGLDHEERQKRLRNLRWVHYPGAEEDNAEGDFFQEAERNLLRQEREKRILRREQKFEPIFLDLKSSIIAPSPYYDVSDLVMADTTPAVDDELGYLIASGGEGGMGNPAFLTTENRSPKFATRGTPGQSVVLSLELKILADVGLVGFPNAGKSTLLRALTGGRAKTEVANYAFTTLNPTVGVVRIADDGSLLGSEDRLTIEDTKTEEILYAEKMRSGELAFSRTRNEGVDPFQDIYTEAFRFTVADNPGLISESSKDVGLGHSFLRSIERSHALVYVVDLSGPAPEEEVKILRDELEAYKPGLSSKARIVLANKADLSVDGDGSEKSAIEEAQRKLVHLESFVRNELGPLDVVPISAKHSQNIRKALLLLRRYVEEARLTKDE